MRNKGDIHRVLKQVGVSIYSKSQHPIKRKKSLKCRETLRHILNRHGEGHLKLVLSLISDAPLNGEQLYSDNIKAVSGLITAFPELEDTPNLVEWFDELDLGEIRAKAKQARLRPLHVVIQTHLTEYFRPAIYGDEQPNWTDSADPDHLYK